MPIVKSCCCGCLGLLLLLMTHTVSGDETPAVPPLIGATYLKEEIDLNKLVYRAEVETQRKKLSSDEFAKWLRDHQAARLFDTVKFKVTQDWAVREKISPTDEEITQFIRDGVRQHPEKYANQSAQSQQRQAMELWWLNAASRDFRTARGLWQKHGGRVGISSFGAYESFEGRNAVLQEAIERGDVKFHADDLKEGFLRRMKDARVQDVLLSPERTTALFSEPTPWDKWLAGLKDLKARTHVSIDGTDFRINGELTYAGRTWNGHRIEGLLLNSRMVQATFDDLNPETRAQWAYPDTERWDAERNLEEFLSAMPLWRKHGLLAITVNFQGGSPQGYSKNQPWHNSAFTETGELRPDYSMRMERVIRKADSLGMVVILGYFYFGQDQRLKDEAAVVAATTNATQWVLDLDFRNVLIEVNNECNVAAYDHAILKPDRVHELIERVQGMKKVERRLLVGTSYGGGAIPRENVVRASDFLLLHGNGVKEPARIAEMVRKTREVSGYRPMPILFNEDDHFEFDRAENNFASALGEHASWGYFDYRMKGEGKTDGFQSVPVDWGITSDRKRGFFGLLSEVTGQKP